MEAQLSPTHIESIQAMVSRIKLGQEIVRVRGSCIQCDIFWSAAHETTAVVAQAAAC